jgi:hypothetical protein
MPRREPRGGGGVWNKFETKMIGLALKNPESFLSTATLRPEEELNQMEQFLYHQHLRARDYQLFPNRQRDPLSDGEQPIEELNPEIVYEPALRDELARGLGQRLG